LQLKKGFGVKKTFREMAQGQHLPQDAQLPAPCEAQLEVPRCPGLAEIPQGHPAGPPLDG
jgi:hypothetical protein